MIFFRVQIMLSASSEPDNHFKFALAQGRDNGVMDNFPRLEYHLKNFGGEGPNVELL
jgi:hypothetical protein